MAAQQWGRPSVGRRRPSPPCCAVPIAAPLRTAPGGPAVAPRGSVTAPSPFPAPTPSTSAPTGRCSRCRSPPTPSWAPASPGTRGSCTAWPTARWSAPSPSATPRATSTPGAKAASRCGTWGSRAPRRPWPSWTAWYAGRGGAACRGAAGGRGRTGGGERGGPEGVARGWGRGRPCRPTPRRPNAGLPARGPCAAPSRSAVVEGLRAAGEGADGRCPLCSPLLPSPRRRTATTTSAPASCSPTAAA